MKQVPYHGNPGNACALACYTMSAQYLLPDEDITFEQFGKIADWRKGYLVWAFPVWKWLMDRGVHIVDYDIVDYETWANQGYESLKKQLPEEEFNYYKENTFDIEAVGEAAKQAFEHPNFTYIRKKVTWKDVEAEFAKGGICELTLNSRALNHQDGFTAHRVVLIHITDEEVVFHDPNKDSTGAYRREPIEYFKTVFESIESPELCRYLVCKPGTIK